MPVVAAGDWVRVHNNEDRTINLPYGSKDNIIKPKSDAMIMFDVALYWYGDPRSLKDKYVIVNESGEKEWIESREWYLNSLAVRYGTYDGGNITGKDGFDSENNPVYLPGIKERMANVSIYTLDGEEIIFPADDPNCYRALPPDQMATAAGQMARRVHELENQLLTLKQLMDENENRTTEEATVASTHTDGPPQPTPLHVNTDNAINAEPNPDAEPQFPGNFITEMPDINDTGDDTEIDAPDTFQSPKSRINPIKMADIPE